MLRFFFFLTFLSLPQSFFCFLLARRNLIILVQELIDKLNLVASCTFLLLLFLPLLLLLSTLFHSVLCLEQFSLSQTSDFHFTFLVETRMAYFFLFRLQNAEITVPSVPVPLVACDIPWSWISTPILQIL